MKREDWSTKTFRLYKHQEGLVKKFNQAYKLGRLDVKNLNSSKLSLLVIQRIPE